MKKTIVVTGGNRGLGLETCRQLLARGQRVILTARDPASGEEAAARLRQEVPGADVAVEPLDLASLGSVRAAAERLLAREPRIDVLIANAGAFDTRGPRRVSPDGFELHFATNHLGHFLLVELLLPKLEASAPSRVVVLSSGLHAGGMGRPPAQLDFDDLQLEKKYDGLDAYARSKLANVLFVRELTRRLAGTGVTAHAASPRMVPETVAAHMTGVSRLMMKYVMPLLPMARTAEQAAANTVFVALDGSVETRPGLYWEDEKPVPSSAASMDDRAGARLFEVSRQLTGAATR